MMDELDYTQPTEEFLRSIDVHELLPQQEPFVMISRLTQFDMLRTVTETGSGARISVKSISYLQGESSIRLQLSCSDMLMKKDV